MLPQGAEEGDEGVIEWTCTVVHPIRGELLRDVNVIELLRAAVAGGSTSHGAAAAASPAAGQGAAVAPPPGVFAAKAAPLAAAQPSSPWVIVERAASSAAVAAPATMAHRMLGPSPGLHDPSGMITYEVFMAFGKFIGCYRQHNVALMHWRDVYEGPRNPFGSDIAWYPLDAGSPIATVRWGKGQGWTFDRQVASKLEGPWRTRPRCL